MPGSYSYLQPKAVVYILCVCTRVCVSLYVCVCQSVSSCHQTWLSSELPQLSTYSCQLTSKKNGTHLTLMTLGRNGRLVRERMAWNTFAKYLFRLKEPPQPSTLSPLSAVT